MKFYSITSQHPNFIEWQVRAFAKFMPMVDLIVVNNGPNHAAIQNECWRVGVECRNAPPAMTPDTSFRNAHALNWIWQQVAGEDDACLIDLDMFPTKPFDPRELMRAHLVGDYQKRGVVEYLWPALIFLRKDLPEPKSINWNPGLAHGVRFDTGGYLYDYTLANPEVTVSILSRHDVTAEDLPEGIRGDFKAEYQWVIHEGGFLHYLRGTNWINHPPEFEKAKRSLFTRWMTNILEN